MSVVIGLVIFVVGALVGFVANKMLSSSSTDEKLLAEKAEQSEANLAQYKQDVAEHLNNSAALLEKMNETCQTAMQQMAKSTELLQQATPELGENIYFAKETQVELEQTANMRPKHAEKRKDAVITEAPLDYSGSPSGLLSNEK